MLTLRGDRSETGGGEGQERRGRDGQGAPEELWFMWENFLSAALGAFINDVNKNFGSFDPLSPCPHLELIYTIKFMQPPLLRPIFP